jgi:hypothetical protein
MTDGMLIPITDEQAKLGQEILKTLRGVGSFLEKALGSTPEDVVGYFGGDRLRVRRAENIASVMYEAQKRLLTMGIQETEPATLNIALPILQGAADEDREQLVDLWARLLATAMNPATRNDVRHSFIEAVKVMDPTDALVLVELYKSNLSAVRRDPSTPDATIHSLAGAIDRRPDDVEASLVHLLSIGFFDPGSQTANQEWFVNANNRELMRSCYPEVGR